MKLLNVGCGGHRPPEPWTNLDTLRVFLKEGTPERKNLDSETNYIECNLLTQSIPVPDRTFDGILIQHVLEHFTCHECTEVLGKCRAVLKDGGVLVASVPDAHYFRYVHRLDIRENAKDLFGESISGDWYDEETKTFFDYALWHREHKQILNSDGLWALLRRAGFDHDKIRRVDLETDLLRKAGFKSELQEEPCPVLDAIRKQLNRIRFSAILFATT